MTDSDTLEMKASPGKNLVQKLKALDLWPMSSSVVGGLEAEMVVEAAKAAETYVAGLTRRKVAAFVAAAPASATAQSAGGVGSAPPSMLEGGGNGSAL